MYDDDDVVITCPIRFRQDWVIAEDAAAFFFPAGMPWTSLVEVRLNDKNGKSAGNVDVVLVAYDSRGRVVDYGALEVQAVYISGNIRHPFEHYMADPGNRGDMSWQGRPNYPRPDYLSSSRKRLAPQLMFKGGILHAWKRKMAVALNKGFYQTLPALEDVELAKADIAWLIYELRHESAQDRYTLKLHRTVYTEFDTAVSQITQPEIGKERDFIDYLQTKLEEKLENGNPPDAPTIEVEL